eukprot:1151890-Pelagomonas_calceolata.AAC.1
MPQTELYPLPSSLKVSLRDLDSPPAVLMLYKLPPTMPNPLLRPPPPAHTMYYAAGRAPYKGSAQPLA